MTKSVELEQLVMLQSLRKQKRAGETSAALSEHSAKAAREAELAGHKRDAEGALGKVFAAPTFCPDRMLLALGHLSEAERRHEIGKQELDLAKERQANARKAWQEAGFQHDILAEQAKTARRKESRRADDTAQAERMSLRAAISKGERR